MDEPLSNLDAKLRVQMRAEVLRVHRRIGAATLYVTHDQTEAMTMGDRVAVLRDGVLQQSGVPRELYDRPANIFVATFMGSPAMNLYEAGLEMAGEAAELVLGRQRLSLPQALLKRVGGLAAFQGGTVIAGIRPESLADPGTAGAPAEPGTRLTVDVQLVEVLGSEQLVHFRLDARRVREEAEVRGQLSVARSRPPRTWRLRGWRWSPRARSSPPPRPAGSRGSIPGPRSARTPRRCWPSTSSSCTSSTRPPDWRSASQATGAGPGSARAGPRPAATFGGVTVAGGHHRDAFSPGTAAHDTPQQELALDPRSGHLARP